MSQRIAKEYFSTSNPFGEKGGPWHDEDSD
jgi:hypothetical protein